MSWTDEEIDKLAREGAANSSVEYKNEYWTEFEAMLPASGKKDVLWFFTAFLFVGLLGTSFVMNGLRNDAEIQTAQNSVQNSESIQKIENAESEASFSTISTTESVNPSSTESESKDNAQLKSESETRVNKSIKKSAQTPINSSSSHQKDGEEQPKDSQILITDIQKDKLESSALQADIKSNTDKNSIELETAVSSLSLRGLNEFQTNPTLMTSMDFSKQKMPARASFYVSGFGGLSQSLITPSKDISTSFGIGIGAQIQKGKFSFTTGLNGVWSNHKDLNLSRSTKVYGFGSNEYNYQFKYKQVYLVEAELSAGYKMGKHLINLGVRPSFIIGTKVAVAETVNNEKKIERNEYGYVDGLNRFGIKPTLGYSFDVTPSFKIGLNVGVELMSKIQEGYLVGSNNRFPIDGQLYLRKSIRFKK